MSTHKYSKRRTENKRKQDTEKAISLFDDGFTLREIAKKLGLTFNQLYEDLSQNYPDKTMWQILRRNSYTCRIHTELRVTKEKVLRARKLLEKYPVQTVANIIGIPHGRLKHLPEGKRSMELGYNCNLLLFALAGEHLLGRYLYEIKPQQWHIRENLPNSNLAPDFWTEEEFWDSKARCYGTSAHKRIVKTELAKYSKLFKKGYVVYWFGVPDNVKSSLSNIELIDGRKLKPTSVTLQKDIQDFLNGNITKIITQMFTGEMV